MPPISKIVGTKSSLWIQAALTHIDVITAEPAGDHLRYDFIVILDDGTYRRVQAKHARIENSSNQSQENAAITFATASKHNNNAERKSVSVNYRGQAEFFAAYSDYTGKAYLIPVTDVGVVSCNLRLLPPRNMQKKNIRFARQYEITPANKEFILDLILKTPFSDCGKSEPPEDQDNIDDMGIDLELGPDDLDAKAPEISEKDFIRWKNEGEQRKLPNLCKLCQAPLRNSRLTYCGVGCSNADRAMSRCPVSKEELENLVELEPLTQIGKRFDVSAYTIKTWCKNYSIKTYGLGYWNKKWATDKLLESSVEI
jgi:hypothetical protein